MSDDDRPLQQALLGAVFPLSPEQLVLLARENEASSAVLSLLESLPRRRFDSLSAVQQMLASQGQGQTQGSLPAEPSAFAPPR
jgi:hypothetical protein